MGPYSETIGSTLDVLVSHETQHVVDPKRHLLSPMTCKIRYLNFARTASSHQVQFVANSKASFVFKGGPRSVQPWLGCRGGAARDLQQEPGVNNLA